MVPPPDAIVIGAGHNGLVCAAYLARAGRRVLVLEAADRPGGAAVTREFVPGFKVSACAHLLHLLPRAVMQDLALERHGLRMAASALPTTALAPGEAPLAAGSGAEQGPWLARLQRLAAALVPAMEQTPPRLGSGNWRDAAALLGLGVGLRRLGRADMRDLLRILLSNIADVLDEPEMPQHLRAVLAFDAVLGGNLGPRSPGTVLPLLVRLAAEGMAGGGLAQPAGGMGAVADALAASATSAGVAIRLAAPVARILVRNDRAAGVELQSGEIVEARTVVSGASPRTTLLGLLGAEHLDTGFVRQVQHMRTRGMTAKLHLALDGLPDVPGLSHAALAGRMLLAPSVDYLERAYNPTKYDGFAAAPALEITVPTLNDPSLAPAGQHVMSVIVQYVPYALRGGWDGGRAVLLETVLRALEGVLPGLRARVLASELLTPPDIEREFRIDGGHWHHAELSFDQFFLLRPVPGATQYVTPLAGLYLCGAGSHPGGGVMGTPGRNAARQILRQAA